MLVHKIELPTTIAFGGSYYLVDRSVYEYEPNEYYYKGDYVISGDKIFKCKKDCKGVAPAAGENYQEITSTKSVTISVTSANVSEFAPGGQTVELPKDYYTMSAADSKFATKAELPDTSNFATKAELPDTSNFATKAELPDVSKFATKEELKKKAASTELASLKTLCEQLQTQVQECTAKIAELTPKS